MGYKWATRMFEMRRLDQYLKQRKGRWYYVRRVPLRYRDVDNRDVIELAFKTGSREVARARRDSLAEADEQLWASLATHDAPTKATPIPRCQGSRICARLYLHTCRRTGR